MDTQATRQGSRRTRRLASRALAVIMTVSALLLILVATGTALGKFRMAPVLTGSMTPNVPQGSMVMAEPVRTSAVRPGDILLFNAPIAGHPLVVHRIYDMHTDPDGPVFHTKGDANPGPDAWTIRVRGAQAWRVVHSVPYAGKVVGLLSRAGLRVVVLVLGVLIAMLTALRALWGLPLISWRADDPFGLARREARRRSTRRAMRLLVVGTALVGTLGGMGFAYATFTNAPVAPTPAFASGSLPTPASLTCTWASATTLSTSWTAVSSGGFATGYHLKRSNTSGSGYATIGTVTPESTATYTDTAPSPPTLRYYVVTSYRSSWDSATSNQVVSSGCSRAISLVAGTGTAGFAGDSGAATSAQLNGATGVVSDTSGNIYVADTANNRIRKITSGGTISTFAGGGANTACNYTGAATGLSLSNPVGITRDASNNVYVSDYGNNCIRKITAAGTVSQVAGGGANTACNYTGTAASVSLLNPVGLAVDSSNNVYIADTGRNCIRKITSGNVSQVAGGGANTACSYSGTATSVSLNTPYQLELDASNVLYLTDSGNNCIRKITSGNVSQVAGGGANTACSYSGTAATVSLLNPGGLAVSSTGAVYISDTGRNCIRKISGGNVSLVAGTGTASYSGDNGPAIAATLNSPGGLDLTTSGDLLVADYLNNRVRLIVTP